MSVTANWWPSVDEMSVARKTSAVVGVVGLVSASGAACSGDSERACISSGEAEVCVEEREGLAAFSAAGLAPNSTVTIDEYPGFDVDADGSFAQPDGSGYVSVFNRVTFRVAATTAAGNELMGALVVEL